MNEKSKKELIINLIKETFESGNYDRHKFDTVFPSYLNESIDMKKPNYNRDFIIRMVYALDLSKTLNEYGLWDYARLQWDKVDRIDKNIFKWK